MSEEINKKLRREKRKEKIDEKKERNSYRPTNSSLGCQLRPQLNTASEKFQVIYSPSTHPSSFPQNWGLISETLHHFFKLLTKRTDNPLKLREQRPLNCFKTQPFSWSPISISSSLIVRAIYHIKFIFLANVPLFFQISSQWSLTVLQTATANSRKLSMLHTKRPQSKNIKISSFLVSYNANFLHTSSSSLFG